MTRALRPDRQVVLTRMLRHPPERVFAAWTSGPRLERWLTPGRGFTLEAEVDCREGGALRFVFRDADGVANRVVGRYLVVRPPERLVFTWTWEASDAPAAAQPVPLPLDAIGVETLVTVDFAARAPGTLLTITHERFATDTEAERHRGGWNGALDQLPAHLEEERQ